MRGAPRPGQPPEADVVAAALGLDAAAVVLETTARNSVESAAAVGRLLADSRPGPVVLVTSPSHIARMSAALRHHRLDVVVARDEPPFRSYAPATWDALDFVPSNRGFKLTRGALWEYAAILWYVMSGAIDLADVWPGEPVQAAASSS